MMLEAISPTCWSDLYVLKLDGRPWGEYRGRWFSECVDIHLTERHELGLEKAGSPPKGERIMRSDWHQCKGVSAWAGTVLGCIAGLLVLVAPTLAAELRLGTAAVKITPPDGTPIAGPAVARELGRGAR